jgi:hypothetical protein
MMSSMIAAKPENPRTSGDKFCFPRNGFFFDQSRDTGFGAGDSSSAIPISL